MILLLLTDDTLFKTTEGRAKVEEAAKAADIVAVVVKDCAIVSPAGGCTIVRFNSASGALRPETPVTDRVDQIKLRKIRELLT